MEMISVVLPCFNAESTIQETLNSISNQDYPKFEVLAVDDGSTDATCTILNEWAKIDDRFKIINQEHAGVIVSANEGNRLAKGNYIARMDADDKMPPNRLSLQAEFLDNNPNIGVVSSLIEGFPAESVRTGFQIYIDWLNSLVTHEEIAREIYIESPLCNPSTMMRREAIKLVGGYQDHGWAEDYDLWLRMHMAGIKFGKVPQVLLSWREHQLRLTRTDSRYSLENFIRAKAHYLMEGLLKNKSSIFIWGAGMNGKRISKYFVRKNMPLIAFVDIDDKKIGSTRRGYPIVSVSEFAEMWKEADNPILLSAVAARGARKLIRIQLSEMGFVEGKDWFGVA